MPALETLFFFPDATPRNGPDQMALDEALLETTSVPVLRIYTWEGPWVSFGYSQSIGTVAASFPECDLVRRWTGGGIVPHHDDWTFALIVPRGQPFAHIRPTESYCAIHRAVASTLKTCEISAHLASTAASGPSVACFAGQPAEHDVLTDEGAKLCGGAQRRVRQGFLHQGSLQNVSIPETFGENLGRTLAAELREFKPSAELLARAEELTTHKYSAREWAMRIS